MFLQFTIASIDAGDVAGGDVPDGRVHGECKLLKNAGDSEPFPVVADGSFSLGLGGNADVLVGEGGFTEKVP
jgi:hypothetical protein